MSLLIYLAKLLGIYNGDDIEYYQSQLIDNNWPDIHREYPDKSRPGLVHVIPKHHIFLCPFEVEAAEIEWDKNNSKDKL
jgi:hypothetical protein